MMRIQIALETEAEWTELDGLVWNRNWRTPVRGLERAHFWFPRFVPCPCFDIWVFFALDNDMLTVYIRGGLGLLGQRMNGS